MAIHPDTLAFLDKFQPVIDSIPFSSISAPALRAALPIPVAVREDATSKALAITEKTIPGRAGVIPVRIYTPKGQSGLQPITMYIHGGGFCLGNPDSTDAVCCQLAIQGNCIVVSVDYRLAPEYAFPAGIEDSEDCLLWLTRFADKIAGDHSRIAVAGNSAGANMATVLAHWARDNDIELCHQLLLFPVTDTSSNTPSCQQLGEGHFLTRAMLDWFWQHYCATPETLTDPRVAPLRYQDHRALAPATVFTAEYDMLRDEGEAYAQALISDGVTVSHTRWLGFIHDFIFLLPATPDASKAVAQASQALRHALHGT